MMKPTLLSVLALAAFGCATDESRDSASQGNTSQTLTIERCSAPVTGDSYALGNVSAAGHDLVVAVRTGGGCAEHSFAVCWDGAVFDTEPGTIELALRHDAHGDSCDALLSWDLRVDLTPVLETFDAPLQIKVVGATAQIAGTTGSALVTD